MSVLVRQSHLCLAVLSVQHKEAVAKALDTAFSNGRRAIQFSVPVLLHSPSYPWHILAVVLW